jgi:hypothetical protein
MQDLKDFPQRILLGFRQERQNGRTAERPRRLRRRTM